MRHCLNTLFVIIMLLVGAFNATEAHCTPEPLPNKYQITSQSFVLKRRNQGELVWLQTPNSRKSSKP